MTEPLRPPGAERGSPFITFEGGEGSGKSTQVRLLTERLTGLGRAVVATREPGGTPVGEVARALAFKPALARRFHRELTGAHWRSIDPLAELFLMEAARAQLVAAVILPALARGAIVISDRFADSTLAYQGAGRGLDPAILRTVNDIATRALHPTLTVLIDLPPAVGLARKRGELGRDAIGGETLAFHERVRAGFLGLAQAEPERWLVLDGARPPDALAAQIWARVAPALACEP